MVRPVEEARREREPAELPTERATLDRARVAGEAPVARRVRGDDRLRGRDPVLERERDALAHEGIGARGVPDEDCVRDRHDGPTRVRPDRERLPGVLRARAEARKLRHELGVDPRPVHRDLVAGQELDDAVRRAG